MNSYNNINEWSVRVELCIEPLALQYHFQTGLYMWVWPVWTQLELFHLCLSCSYRSSNNSKAVAKVQMAQLNVLFILFAQMDFSPPECQNLNLRQGWGSTPTSCFHLCLFVSRGCHYKFLLFWKSGSNSLFPQKPMFPSLNLVYVNDIFIQTHSGSDSWTLFVIFCCIKYFWIVEFLIMNYC